MSTTKADFYIKREGIKELEWIGSCEYETMNLFLKEALEAKTERDYYTSLSASFETDEEHYVAIHGWPWKWETSEGTDVAYVFDTDKVLENKKGAGWTPVGGGKKVKNDYKFPKFKTQWE